MLLKWITVTHHIGTRLFLLALSFFGNLTPELFYKFVKVYISMSVAPKLFWQSLYLIFFKTVRILYSNEKNTKNVLLSRDIFYTTLSYHKFISELHVKVYIRIAKQIWRSTVVINITVSTPYSGYTRYHYLKVQLTLNWVRKSRAG
jgi:hypothetical protein